MGSISDSPSVIKSEEMRTVSRPTSTTGKIELICLIIQKIYKIKIRIPTYQKAATRIICAGL